MANIVIPFTREMAIRVINGRKCATTRSERKGDINDTFRIIDPGDRHHVETFRIIDIWEVNLAVVANVYYRLEGFDNPEKFEKTWRALHRGHFTIGKLYYMHIFERLI